MIIEINKDLDIYNMNISIINSELYRFKAKLYIMYKNHIQMEIERDCAGSYSISLGDPDLLGNSYLSSEVDALEKLFDNGLNNENIMNILQKIDTLLNKIVKQEVDDFTRYEIIKDTFDESRVFH